MGLWFSYWWVILPALVLGMIARARVRNTYQRYSQIRTRSGVTGAQMARQILGEHGLGDIPVERIGGNLTDHYDPKRRVLRLSQGVYDSPTVAAVGVAAHEAGHAIQHARAYTPLTVRNAIFPVASFGSNFGPIIVILGLLFGAIEPLIMVGIALFAAAVVFSLVTLPVEFNASRRAIGILSAGALTSEEVSGARSVLSAAALTYVASALASVLTLLRLLLLSRRG